MAIAIFLEIVQLRGFLFSAAPLKPDFTRLNPAKGLKRIFSVRMLKETLKTVVKTAVYGVVLWLLLRQAVDRYAPIAVETERLAEIARSAGLHMLLVLLLVAFFFVAIDQLLVRREFVKQMRMSRREVGRETRDREGEPRIKRKRQKLHAELVSQAKGMGKLAGSDLLVVNPEHFAVALRYDAKTMAAPTVTVKGRNKVALAIKAEAIRLGIPIFAQPILARALFKSASIGREVGTDQFEQVAALYTAYFRNREARAGQ
jgi:flagellar biosynthetic protein FlhB